MKTMPKMLLILITALLLPCGIASAQRINAQHFVGEGHGLGYYGKSNETKPYLARTAYRLSWTGTPTHVFEYDRDRAEDRNAEVFTVVVRDADTGRTVARTGGAPLRGSLDVPHGGRHYVVIIGIANFRANITEDEAVLRSAAAQGKLRHDVVLEPGPDAEETPLTPREAAEEEVKVLEAMKRAVDPQAEDRHQQLNALAAHILAVRRAAQAASDLEDYKRRRAVLLQGL